jgi:anti-sigma regulatory factor (Ser/Thr protein kinase)
MTGGGRSITLPGSTASASAARRFVDQVLAEGDRSALSYVATMLVSELVANAVLHTGTEIRVAVRISGDVARVEVHDGSHQLPMRKHYSAMSGTGRGLMMVERAASGWGAEPTSDGKVVWFELDGATTVPFDLLEVEAL